MVGKAVEMGVARMTPVLTQHGQVARVNRERMEANAIEAAEQCGILSLPRIDEPVALDSLLASWTADEPDRRIVFCDEADGRNDPLAILSALPPSPLAVLIGPEGGFSAAEREQLRALPHVTPLPLGRRILPRRHRRRGGTGAGAGGQGGLATALALARAYRAILGRCWFVPPPELVQPKVAATAGVVSLRTFGPTVDRRFA